MYRTRTMILLVLVGVAGGSVSRGAAGASPAADKPKRTPDSVFVPTPDDVLLVVEVADTSAGFDRDVKMPMYARAGIVEADHLDHARVLEVARPYLGEMAGAYTDWTPLDDRGTLFPEDMDPSDPWQFKNVRVA